MTVKVLAADFIKIRRTLVWFLVFLGPIGAVGLQAVNFFLRYDYLTKEYEADLWGGVLSNVQFMAAPALLLGMALLTSMIAGYEHQTNAWKQLLALPVTRFSVFTAKLLLIFILLVVSCLVLAVCTILLGGALNYGWNFPVTDLLRISFFPLLAGAPILTLQLWLAITIKNQAIPLTVGILGTVLSLFGANAPDWFFWKWPLLLTQAGPEQAVWMGLALGAVVFCAGLTQFNRQDVN
ncbi:ABC transporter permease [Paenibacillus sp. FJAT-26967]|uniref:ABC transporter permease n=1 Tax=Paenibacillus sp. FJAT-26967 TaxID=1729690 RepID=UPI00083827C3|nr:ABC transporter permease [Paenibacillus sp. FJAT-26967]